MNLENFARMSACSECRRLGGYAFDPLALAGANFEADGKHVQGVEHRHFKFIGHLLEAVSGVFGDSEFDAGFFSRGRSWPVSNS